MLCETFPFRFDPFFLLSTFIGELDKNLNEDEREREFIAMLTVSLNIIDSIDQVPREFCLNRWIPLASNSLSTKGIRDGCGDF